MSDDCQLSAAPFFQCCCTCKFRVPVVKRWPWWLHRIFRVLHLPRLPLHRNKGWACANYDLSGVTIGWPEHSCGCEMHTPRGLDMSDIMIELQKDPPKAHA